MNNMRVQMAAHTRTATNAVSPSRHKLDKRITPTHPRDTVIPVIVAILIVGRRGQAGPNNNSNSESNNNSENNSNNNNINPNNNNDNNYYYYTSVDPKYNW